MRTERDTLQVNFLATRNWVLFNLLIREKISVRIALRLLVADIDLAAGTLKCPRKVLPLKPEMVEVLRYYLSTFTCLSQPDMPLFPSRNGKFIFASNYCDKILQPAVHLIDPDLQLTDFHPAKLPAEIRVKLLINPNEVETIEPIDALLCKLEIWLGLRPEEFSRIRCCDVDFSNELIVLRETKSGGDQEVPIPSPLLAELRAATLHLQPEELVFKKKTGKPVGRRYVDILIRRWGERRGLEGVTPQMVRRSVAYNLEDTGAAPVEVESLLRHAGTSTLRQSYSPPDISRARKALKHHPANQFYE
jgi:integrase